MTEKIALNTQDLEWIPFPIPGATPGGVLGKLLNLDPGAGMIATLIRIEPGACIPAHFHKKGAEAHYVIAGDFIENGVAYGPGAFFTHAAGVVHGPHESQHGCSVLTLQTAFVDPADPDFHLAAPQEEQIDRAAIARRFYEVLNTGAVSLLDEILAEDWAEQPLAPGQAAGRDGYKPIVHVFRTAFPDVHFVNEDVFTADDKELSAQS